MADSKKLLFERISGFLISKNTKHKLRLQKEHSEWINLEVWLAFNFFFFFPQIHQMSFVDKIKVIESVIDVNYIGELSWD